MKRLMDIVGTMTLTIRRADFDDPRLPAFLAAHLADMAPQSPPESQHALDFDALKRQDVRLWVGTAAGQLAVTCALAPLVPGHEELKSMRTHPGLRGQGFASRILEHAIADATQRGIKRISLETGAAEFFAPARKLYAVNGFEPCMPFGHYGEDPHSIFMSRSLARSGLQKVIG